MSRDLVRPSTRRLRSLPALILLLLLVAALAGACSPSAGFTVFPGWVATGVSDGLLVTADRTGALLGLDPKSGAQRWRFSREGSASLQGLYGTPLISDGVTYAGTYNGTLYALDAQGVVQWEYATEGPIVGGPVRAGNFILVSSSNNSVYALDHTNNGRLAWKYTTGQKIWASPTVSGDRVYVASMDHNVHALSLTDGAVVWKHKIGGAMATRPLVSNGLVIVGAFDKNLYALDAATGTERWTFTADDWFWASPVTDGTSIYAASMGGTVYALNQSGTQAWKFTGKGPYIATPVVLAEGVVVVTDAGRLSLLNKASGSETWPYDAAVQVRAPLSSLGATVYLGSLDSSVIAIDTAGSKQAWKQSLK